MAIRAKSVHPAPRQRSTSNRSSSVALSVHARSICELLTTVAARFVGAAGAGGGGPPMKALDRKSTRLNSSHGYISYAVFCLKKKKKKKKRDQNSTRHLGT